MVVYYIPDEGLYSTIRPILNLLSIILIHLNKDVMYIRTIIDIIMPRTALRGVTKRERNRPVDDGVPPWRPTSRVGHQA